MISGFPNAFEMFAQEDRDVPKDCHIHCMCWDGGGECCECHEVKGPEPMVEAEDKDDFRTQADGVFEEEDESIFVGRRGFHADI